MRKMNDMPGKLLVALLCLCTVVGPQGVNGRTEKLFAMGKLAIFMGSFRCWGNTDNVSFKFRFRSYIITLLL